jgi:putative salt-induced outer membrane protein
MRFKSCLILASTLVLTTHAYADSQSSDAASKTTYQGHLQNPSIIPQGFSNDTELGFVQSEGNSNAQTTNLKQLDSYSWSGNMLSGQYNFLRSESDGVESARRWQASLLFVRDLSKSFGAFVFQGYESDRHAGYELRSHSEAGMKFNIVKQEDWSWLALLGYRYTDEQRLQPPRYYSDFGHIYNELNAQLNPSVWLQIWAEYLPNFSHNKDFQINAEASVSVMLSRILSLKSSYEVIYDNVPAPGATHQRDTLLTTSLVAKF